MTILVSLLVGFLASLAGSLAAQRKGRRAKLWMVGCFLAAPLLLIIELLPATPTARQSPPTHPRFSFIIEWLGVSVVVGIVLLIVVSLIDPSLIE